MKFVKLYIKSLMSKRVQPQQAAPAGIDYSDLPGLKTHKQMNEEAIRKYKREYTISVRQYQKMVLDHKAAKGKRRKELKQALGSQLDHLQSMLVKIGSYTSSEKAMGFEVPDVE